VELGKRAVSNGLMAVALLGGLALAGCDENVEVLRDPDVRVAAGMTWAWRPMAPPAAVRARHDAEDRAVVSRDVINSAAARPEHLESNRDWNTEPNRNRLREAIEKGLRSKGLVQASDPATADFLVDYHVRVATERGVAQEVYPGWGWGWWGPPAVWSYPVRYHEGTFVLDIAKQNPKKLAYRAIGHRDLGYGYNRNISSYQAENAVNHLLHGLKTK
jgi:hypothetical protein